MKSTLYNINGKFLFSLFFVAALCFSCDIEKFELPEAGSIPDETPPSASFAYQQGEDEDFLKYNFSNLSASSTSYSWDFGDGNTSTDKDASNTFPSEGTYTVMLTASDNLNVSNSVSQTIEVVKPEPPGAILPDILEPGFEDNSLPDGSGDGRDSWRCSFGEIMQITSGPTNSGDQAAKFPSNGERTAYQELVVSPNVDYALTYYYTMKTDPGTLTVRIMDGPLSDLPTNEDNTLASFVGDDNSDANTYVKVTIPFNTGANETIALLITNGGSEARLDDFSIEIVQ